MLPGHSYHWNNIGRSRGYAWLYCFSFFLSSNPLIVFAAGTHPVLLEGEETVVRARQLPLDRRQVPFLLSDSALHRSSLWGKRLSIGAL